MRCRPISGRNCDESVARGVRRTQACPRTCSREGTCGHDSATCSVGVAVGLPVRLEEDAVDLFEIDDACAVPYGFVEAAEGEVSGASQESIGGADEECESVFAEGAVGECDVVELLQEVFLHLFRGESADANGVGDAASDVVVDGEGELGEKWRLCDEDEVVVLGE